MVDVGDVIRFQPPRSWAIGQGPLPSPVSGVVREAWTDPDGLWFEVQEEDGTTSLVHAPEVLDTL